MASSTSSNKTSNPTTTGYVYGGGQSGKGSGFDLGSVGDDFIDGKAGLATGSGINVGRAGGNVTINRETVNDDVLRSAGNAIMGAFEKLSDDSQAITRGTAQALDRSGQRVLALTDDLAEKSNEAAKAIAQGSVKAAGNAIDANTDTVKRALDFGDKSLEEVSQATGQSVGTIADVVNDAFGYSKTQTDKTLDAMIQSAQDTADAFARAAGGQSQETQLTVRRTATLMAAAVAVMAIANNWN